MAKGIQLQFLPTMTIYAHTDPKRPVEQWESMETHAEAVALLAEAFCEKFAPGYGRALAWLHDSGKYQPAFQEYLQRDYEAYDESKSRGVPHSIVGALFAEQTAPPGIGRLLAWPIAAHHSALKDKAGLAARLQGARSQLEDALRETSIPHTCRRVQTVAPFTGAWIETARNSLSHLQQPSRPSRARGLKPTGWRSLGDPPQRRALHGRVD